MTGKADERRGDEASAASAWDDEERLWARNSRPERPPMSDLTPAPVFGIAAMPRALRRAQTFWYVGVAMLFFSGITIFLTRNTLVAGLVTVLRERDATVSSGRLQDVLPYVLYITIAALLLVAVPQWGFTTLLSLRRRWPRWVLLPLTLAHVTVVGAGLLVIPEDTWAGWLLTATLCVGAVMSVVALFYSFAPAVTRWIRTRDEENEPA